MKVIGMLLASILFVCVGVGLTGLELNTDTVISITILLATSVWITWAITRIPKPPICPFCGKRARHKLLIDEEGNGEAIYLSICKECKELYRRDNPPKGEKVDGNA